MGNFLAGRMWALNVKTLMAQDFWNFVFVGHDLIATRDLYISDLFIQTIKIKALILFNGLWAVL